VRMKQRSISKADVEHVMEIGNRSRDPSWTPDEPTYRISGRITRNVRIRVVFRREVGQDVVVTAIKL
jgi:Domain of unknown function (DUF4258)